MQVLPSLANVGFVQTRTKAPAKNIKCSSEKYFLEEFRAYKPWKSVGGRSQSMKRKLIRVDGENTWEVNAIY